MIKVGILIFLLTLGSVPLYGVFMQTITLNFRILLQFSDTDLVEGTA